MSVIRNLIDARFIKQGTWVGLDNSSRAIIERFVVEEFSQTGDVIATDVRTMSRVRFQEHMIAEIDGMRLDRFLQQADLNKDGLKITGMKRRGRKPRVRT
jgi:hypothetical protein